MSSQRGQQMCSKLFSLGTSDPGPHNGSCDSKSVAHSTIPCCTQKLNSSRQASSTSTRLFVKRNFMVGKIKSETKTAIFSLSLFRDQTLSSNCFFMVALHFKSEGLFNKSLNLFSPVYHLNQINDFRVLHLPPIESG